MAVWLVEVGEVDMTALNEREENIVGLGGVVKPQKVVLTTMNQGTTSDFRSHLGLEYSNF